MQKFPLALVALILASVVFAGGSKRERKVEKAARQRIADEDRPVTLTKSRAARTAANSPPGTFLITSTYDIESNGSMPNQIVNFGNGTLSLARMTATDASTNDRGSFFSHFDGTNWSPPVKVEILLRGWTSLDVFSDDREVVVSHIANEVSMDILPGFGIWNASITGFIPGATDHVWPRVAVDGRNNIHIVSTLHEQMPGARLGLYYPVHTWSTDEGATWGHQFIFGDPFTELDTTDGQWQGFAIDSYAIATWGANRVAIVALAGGAIAANNLWLAIADDNGATWNVRRITDHADVPAPGVDEFRPTTAVDLIFDQRGNVHVFSTNHLVRLEVGGFVSFFHSEIAPLRHWSEATGWVEMMTYADIPGFDPNEEIFDGLSTGSGQNNTLLQMPQAGIDEAGNLYVVFNTVTPHDTTFDGLNYMDVYAVGSGDGGANWGLPVNVTNNPGMEDMWASLADLVDDNLHILYSTDPDIGHGITGSPFFMDHYYYAFPKSQIDFTRPGVLALAIPDTLTGSAGDTVAVPVFLARDENKIAALGAALKASNRILSFVDFTPGAIVGANVFDINPVAPDSLRLGFVDFGGGPITADGILATLRFKIDPGSQEGQTSQLRFSDLSAADADFNSLNLVGRPGLVTVVTQPAQILGAKWEDLNGNGQRDDNEPGLANWMIELTGADTLTTFTDVQGNFQFSNLLPGDYVVAEAVPEGWRQTFPPVPGTHAITLQSGQTRAGIDFGNAQYSQLRGMKWNDLNENSQKDSNEPGLPNWRIWLQAQLPGGQTINDTAATDSEGRYAFVDLMPGQYTIGEVLLEQWQQTHPSQGVYTLKVISGTVSDTLDFGNLDVSVSVARPETAALPQAFELFQNYPNPFNPATTIKFGLPRPSYVKLELFNLMGARAAVLLEGKHEAGFHEVKWEAEGFPAGVYFYKITAGEFVMMRKLLLMK